jgi:O-methyltransferase
MQNLKSPAESFVGGTAEEMVSMIYNVVLGRPPDPIGFASKVTALKNGASFDSLLLNTLRSEEYTARHQAHKHAPPPAIPDGEYYRPNFSPWLGYGEFSEFYKRTTGKTLVSADRCHILYQIALQALHVKGDFWECGVYKGGTAAMLSEILAKKGDGSKRLCLFDTFEGMPETDSVKDIHKKGDFSDTSATAVKELVRNDEIVEYYCGFIPDTFHDLESATISFAHVDVDIYKAVVDCCEFIFPRLSPGGFMVCDDYGFPSCPGARAAVDEFFMGRPVQPIVLPTGQALVFKGSATKKRHQANV